MTLSQLGVLFVALGRAGFPRPWKRLNDASKTQLVSLLAGITKGRLRGDKETYPPVIIEEGAAEFELSENCWRVGQLEPFELSLFREWEHSGRRYFFGFIRIDRSYNETEASKAFRAWFKDHWRETKGGGSPKWQAKLNDLVVMRLWKQFPKRTDAIKRVEHIVKFTIPGSKRVGFKGCKEWWKNHFRAQKEKRVLDDQTLSNAANEEMGRARECALEFFQTLSPGEIPLNYKRPLVGSARLGSNQKSR